MTHNEYGLICTLWPLALLFQKEHAQDDDLPRNMRNYNSRFQPLEEEYFLHSGGCKDDHPTIPLSNQMRPKGDVNGKRLHLCFLANTPRTIIARCKRCSKNLLQISSMTSLEHLPEAATTARMARHPTAKHYRFGLVLGLVGWLLIGPSIHSWRILMTATTGFHPFLGKKKKTQGFQPISTVISTNKHVCTCLNITLSTNL